MFSYYGSKSKIVDCYPKPKHGKIIEPFAGSARYSLKWFERDVLLVDKYDVVIRVWKYLQQASEGDIKKLPRLKEGNRLSEYSFDCVEARWLMGFIIGNANQSPREKANFRGTTHRPNLINYQIKNIAGQLYKIRHWEIKLGSYDEIENQEATWFIDPPYKNGGSVYVENNKNLSYADLAKWCNGRSGQVIVCENMSGDWLPFKPLTKLRGSLNTTTEAIWSNQQTAYDNEQQNLFAMST
jgi:site-specific DNA-adenine methylase